MATTETMFPDQSDFDYDYETLRTTGVVLAVIMFVSGILIALSKKIHKMCKILIQFKLIWYPNSKDRSTSSSCLEHIAYA
ncbi:FXYD domain containing ion transport regulator 7 [Brachyistius frenatus]|uniref:FXYD domain containing ion transport regulator 7 n=1 Tax=Brachyistius frenatus TaxID=100188 RepID=UPI0037E93C6D